MKKLIFLSLFATLVTSTTYGAGTSNQPSDKAAAKSEEKKEAFKLIHVADLESMLQAKNDKVYVFDANTKETRMKEGLIPGAKLLSKVGDYNVAETLPSDKNAKLVFYCANTVCSASHLAATRATENGYKNVSVMADGIKGWKEAGKKVAKPTNI